MRSIITMIIAFLSSCVPQSDHPKYSSDWVSEHTQMWKQELAGLMDKHAVSYLEIGVWEGRSLIWMMQNIFTHESAKATAIDLFPDEVKNRFLKNLEAASLDDKVHLINGNSRDVLHKLPQSSFDLIYIDGSHIAKDVLMDAMLGWPLLKVGGFMLFDDYLMGRAELPDNLRPYEAVNAFTSLYGEELEVIHKGYQVLIKKKPGVTQPYNNLVSRIGDYDYYWDFYNLGKKRGLFSSDDEKVPISQAQERQLRTFLKGRKLNLTDTIHSLFYLNADLLNEFGEHFFK